MLVDDVIVAIDAVASVGVDAYQSAARLRRNVGTEVELNFVRGTACSTRRSSRAPVAWFLALRCRISGKSVSNLETT